jgi:hypothetical protein
MEVWPEIDLIFGMTDRLPPEEQRPYGRKWIDERVATIAGELGQVIERPLEWQASVTGFDDNLRVIREGMPWLVIPISWSDLEDIHSTGETRVKVEAILRDLLKPRPAPPLSGMAMKEIPRKR